MREDTKFSVWTTVARSCNHLILQSFTEGDGEWPVLRLYGG